MLEAHRLWDGHRETGEGNGGGACRNKGAGLSQAPLSPSMPSAGQLTSPRAQALLSDSPAISDNGMSATQVSACFVLFVSVGKMRCPIPRRCSQRAPPAVEITMTGCFSSTA